MRFKLTLLLILSGLTLVPNLFHINASNGTDSKIISTDLAQSLPDLAISDIFLTDNNQLNIEITNLGLGHLHKKYWDYSQVFIYLYQDGKLWGGISLKICDPFQKLHYPQSKTLYTINRIHLNNTSQIMVVIDPQNTVRESNEANNSLQKLLTIPSPDLAVTNIWMVNGNRLAVELINNGPQAVDLKYWDQIPVYFEIYLNGQSQMRIPLKAIDPGRKLAEPGGKIVYITQPFPNSDWEEVKAVIDSHNRITETDESNNRFLLRIAPN